ncbi:MAG: cysteine desulfurase [Chloroflexi bacterium]|nr:cysteine desulfurase [Chloroflexota bacterium]NOG62178.1 cysteine desulfurase [Chloroflexota bacterium]
MIYLDYSATTPTDPRVVEAMLPYFTNVFGNASSAHRIGHQAQFAIEQARETIASVLNCKPHEVIFTSGGSESDNLAVRGVAWTHRKRGKHLVTSAIEHGAVGKTIVQLADDQGFECSVLPVDPCGKVRLDEVSDILRPDTTLLSVMYANNEIGTIQPIPELAHLAHDRGVIFHTDAVQAAGQLSLDVQKLGVDLMSLSAHKFYGPKGIGALYIRDGIDISPAQTGGGHERGLRAGTHATPLIVGFAKALELADQEFQTRITHLQHLRNTLIEGILKTIPGAILTGHPHDRLPSHASFVFEGIHGSFLISYLDDKGIAASGASACKAGSHAPSSVLLALGYSPELASASLRLTVGIHTTQQEIAETIRAVALAVKNLKRVAVA